MLIMHEKYSFPGQFKCMYCKIDFDQTNKQALGHNDFVDIQCHQCKAVWRFFAKVLLYHKLSQPGKYNRLK